MTLSVKHKFASAKADGSDTALIQPSNWNDTHAITGTANRLLGLDSSGAGAEVSVDASLTLTGNVLKTSFAAVQQGGGTGQTTNKLYIGWSASAKLLLQVDSTDYGYSWPISITGSAAQVAGTTPGAGGLAVLAAANQAAARTALGVGSIATRALTISTAAPSGGADGDIWFKTA